MASDELGHVVFVLGVARVEIGTVEDGFEVGLHRGLRHEPAHEAVKCRPARVEPVLGLVQHGPGGDALLTQVVVEPAGGGDEEGHPPPVVREVEGTEELALGPGRLVVRVLGQQVRLGRPAAKRGEHERRLRRALGQLKDVADGGRVAVDHGTHALAEVGGGAEAGLPDGQVLDVAAQLTQALS